jgi:hypothetical protein
MSLVLVQDLPAIIPVRNPAWLEVLCDSYQASAPTKAEYIIGLLSNPVAGYEFKLFMPGGEELVFTYVTGTPDDSGTQVQRGGSDAATLANLLTALQGNWYVDQLFTVTNETTHLELVARQAGVTVMSFQNTSPATMSFASAGPGTDGSFAPAYTGVVQPYVERTWGSGEYVALPAFENTPDTDRRTRWDLSTLLKPEVTYNWPTYGTTTLQLQRNLQRRVYITRYEQFGDPPAPQIVKRGAVKKLWYGGSRQLEHNVFTSFFQMVESTALLTPWLTYRGRSGRHEVSAPQQHYLAWYRNVTKVSGQQIYVKAVVTYADASTETTNVWVDTNGSDYQLGDVALFPAGFDLLGLDGLSAEEPVSYTLQVFNPSDVALSQAHTFHLVDADYNELHIEYVNSLGVVESLRCTGSWAVGNKTQHDLVQRLRVLVDGTPPSREGSDRSALLRGNQRTLQVSSGNMDAGELQAVLDVLYSPEWRLLDHARETREALTLVEAEVVEVKRGVDDEHLYALNLKYLIGDDEMAWSDRTLMPDVPDEEPEEPES